MRYIYFSDHVADEFGCDGGSRECTMDIHVRRMGMKHGRSEHYYALTAIRQAVL